MFFGELILLKKLFVIIHLLLYKPAYIYAFSRCFYPKRLTVHSGYTFFVSTCVLWESNPQPFALLMQCSTTEPQEHVAWLSFFNTEKNMNI